MKTFLSIRAYFLLPCLFCLISMRGTAQTSTPDQRLISLNNGYQLMGYIVEQRPGIDLKLYRPTENDTVTVKLDEIKKVSRISVASFSAKPSTPEAPVNPARFNTKKNVFQVSYLAGYSYQQKTNPLGFAQGFGGAYYRSVKNHFFYGGSVQYITGSSYRQNSDPDYAGYEWETKFLSITAEGKMRLSGKPQMHRVSTELGLQAGYIRSNAYFEEYSVNIIKHQITDSNGLVAGASVSFRINPDRNSGFSLEPGISFFKPETFTYQVNNHNLIVTSQTRKESMKQISLRCSYYF